MPPVAINRLINEGSKYSVLPEVMANRIRVPVMMPKIKVNVQIKRTVKRDILEPPI